MDATPSSPKSSTPKHVSRRPAISYNTAFAAFGGTAPLIGTALVAGTGVPVAPGYYITAAAVVVLVLLIVTGVPETRGRVD